MTPDDYTVQETYLEVGDGHTLYVHEWGRKGAKTPIIVLHGGPGSATRDRHKQLFDPTRQRVIFFDQRGCGKSLPYGSLEHNTTADLIADIEKIAIHLKLNTFVITGGSWGSCLALGYALTYPKRVKAMVLHGIFTGAQTEIDWLDKGRFTEHFPDVWDLYLAATPKEHQSNPSKYHFRQALSDDPVAAKKSAYAYGNLEGALLSLDDRYTPQSYEVFDPVGSRLEMYYLANGCFMPDNYILHNAPKLHMPIWLVQGRYDFVCPPRTAYELHRRLPDSDLIWTTSGHKDERESWNVQRTLLLQLAGK